MAIRQKPSGAWEVYYRHPITGKRKSETYATQKDAVQHDALIKYRIKFERESFELEEEPQQQTTMTFEDVLWMFLKSKHYDKTALANQLAQFKCWIEEFKDQEIKSVTRVCLEKAKDKLISKGLRGTTVRRRFAAMKALLRWCCKEELINSVPVFPEMPRDDTEHFIPPTKDEIMIMMRYAPRHIQRVIILGFCFGARVGPCELFRLAWSDVDIERRVLRMPSSKKNIREPWRELPIRDELIPVFEQWKNEDSMLAERPETVVHFRGKSVRQVHGGWRSMLKKSGIRHIRPYDLRHAFATEALAAGVDVGTAAKMMGHTSPVMILTTYQHVMDKQKRQAMEALPCVSDSVCLKRISSKNVM